MANDANAPLPHVEVANYLEAQGVAGGDTDWKLTRGFMPSAPDQVLAVFPAGGQQPEGKYDLRHPNVQLRIRGAVDEQTPAMAKLREAEDLLKAARGVTIGQGRYAGFFPLSDLMALGRDEETHRYEYTITLRAAREPASA